MDTLFSCFLFIIVIISVCIVGIGGIIEILNLRKKEYNLFIWLKCPDGKFETASFDIPSQIDSFLKYINDYNNSEGYSFIVRKRSKKCYGG